MNELELAEIAQAVRGVLDIERTDTGVIPVRLPQRLAYQVPNRWTDEVFRNTSGVRLELQTEAAALEIDLIAYRIAVTGFESSAFPFTFDLVIDGAIHSAQTVSDVGKRLFDTDANLISEDLRAITVRFDGLPPGEKTLELWFPPTAVVEIRALRVDAATRPREDHRPCWIHYGSSISHCADAHSPTQTWPAVAARIADVDLLNLGVDGNCHLDQFVARAIRDTPATFISLKVGINIVNGDSLKVRTFAPAVHGFLDTVREGQPDTPILLVSPIICPPHEDTPGPTVTLREDSHFVAGARAVTDPETERQALSLRRMREMLEEIVRVRRTADANLHYLSGLTLFDKSDLGDLPDLLHPNGDGYVRMGQRFAEAAFGPNGAFAPSQRLQ